MCSFSEEGHRVWKWFYQGDNEEGRPRPNEWHVQGYGA